MDDKIQEEQLIREMAEPILELLLNLQEQQGSEFLEAIPSISILNADDSNPETSCSPEFLKRLQDYIQQEMDAWFKPTLLN